MNRSRSRAYRHQPWWSGIAQAGLVVAYLALTTTPALAVSGGRTTSTADHSQFEALDKKFQSGPDVTRACLGCHTEAAKQIHATQHWTWEFDNPATGQKLGKRHVVNNFCISTASNMAGCSSCHVGYGWTDDSFDFTDEEKVDCLGCHDTTGTYTKDPKLAKPNLRKVARSVGPTSRASCGACHFKGGGGVAVKHGDLDPTLVEPDIFVDVHMDADGLDFACSTCHRGDAHSIAGSRYAPTAADTKGIDVPGRGDGNRASCRSCHGEAPHEDDPTLDGHSRRVACQTCHIPEYSRGDYASKEWWDWSTVGETAPDGTPLSKFDADDNEIYSSKKGDFVWRDNVVPEYVWFNGTVDYTLLGDRVDPGQVVPINSFRGGPDDPGARIWPVKVMRGKQPYDKVHLTLAVPHTVGKHGLWKTFDWESALSIGMQAAGMTFSGEYGFVETTMLWPINHMVAPKEEVLACADCHANGGRLEGVEGVYIPGRDANRLIDRIGFVLLGLTFVGVVGHGLTRIVVRAIRGAKS